MTGPKQVDGAIRGWRTGPIGFDGQHYRFHSLVHDSDSAWPKGVQVASCHRIGQDVRHRRIWVRGSLQDFVKLDDGEYAVHDDRPAFPGCSCGMYAFFTEEELVRQESAKNLHLLVESWGRVIKAKNGYRSEFMLPVALAWPRCQHQTWMSGRYDTTQCTNPASQALFVDVRYRTRAPAASNREAYREWCSTPQPWMPRRSTQTWRCKDHAWEVVTAPWPGYDSMRDRCRAKPGARGHRKATVKVVGMTDHTQRTDHGVRKFCDECRPHVHTVEEVLYSLAEFYELDVLPFMGEEGGED